MTLIAPFAHAHQGQDPSICTWALDPLSMPLGVQWTPHTKAGSVPIPAVLRDPIVQKAYLSEDFRQYLLRLQAEGRSPIRDFKQLADAAPRFPGGLSAQVLPSNPTNDEILKHIVDHYKLSSMQGDSQAQIPTGLKSDHHPLFGKIKGPLVQQSLESVHQMWEQLLRQDRRITGSSRLVLPNPYVVAGGRFTEGYFWDSYWIFKGLIESGYGSIALGMLENWIYLFERYGIIPNGNRFYYLSRTQPPILMEMIRLLEENGLLKFNSPRVSNPTSLESRALRVADEYYKKIWLGTERFHKKYGLFSYSDGAGGATAPERLVVRPERGLVEPVAQEVHSHRVYAESGWDMSYTRFGTHPQDFLPVDLNAILAGYTQSLGNIYRKVGLQIKADAYDLESQRIQSRIEKYLFDPKAGSYFDYNIVAGTRSHVITAAAFFPYYFLPKDPTTSQNQLLGLLKKLKPDGHLGLHTTDRDGNGQWDGSWTWAPLNEMAYQALRKNGLHEEALRLAFDYSLMVISAYHRNGRKFFEKYRGEDGSITLPKGSQIYGNEEGFGWTNATLAVFLKDLKQAGLLDRLEDEVAKRLRR